ncbi:hypothetical protein ACN20G_16445 [Streptomyces sp. BI20]|uniref:hypothetical protein n=1 Tax=Streptomyces sp. BI20 TaxID=3403460 RepID=UPI003C717730
MDNSASSGASRDVREVAEAYLTKLRSRLRRRFGQTFGRRGAWTSPGQRKVSLRRLHFIAAEVAERIHTYTQRLQAYFGLPEADWPALRMYRLDADIHRLLRVLNTLCRHFAVSQAALTATAELGRLPAWAALMPRVGDSLPPVVTPQRYALVASVLTAAPPPAPVAASVASQ